MNLKLKLFCLDRERRNPGCSLAVESIYIYICLYINFQEKTCKDVLASHFARLKS